MTIDELKQQVLELIPHAIFDKEYRTGEIMISTGLFAGPDGKLWEVDDVLGEG